MATHICEVLLLTTPQSAVLAMLKNIQANGWNPATGHLFINWRTGTNPLQTDFQTSGKTDAQMGVKPPRQDGHTTLRYLENLYLWRHWQNDHQFDSEITKAEQAAKSWLGTSPSNPRGWVYFDLCDMATYSGDAFWQDMASKLVDSWKNYPAPVKSVAGSNDPTQRTDWHIEVGCAMVAEGRRRNDQAMIQSGQQRIDTAWSLNVDPQKHVLWSQGEVKAGEAGQEIEALATIGDARAAPLLVAMDYLLMPSGGYYAKDNQQTGIQTTKTEPGRSSEMLRAAVLCEDSARVAKLLDVVCNKAYRAELAGVVYECNPDWSLRKAQAGGNEDWVTTEAMGITCKALMVASMGQTAPLPEPTPTPVPTPTPQPNPPPTDDTKAAIAALQQQVATLQSQVTALQITVTTDTTKALAIFQAVKALFS